MNLFKYFRLPKTFLVFAFAATASVTSCKKFVEVGAPQTEITPQAVFENDLSALSALKGIYSLMMTNQSFTKAGIEELTGIASDEFLNYSTRADQIQFFQNSLTSRNSDVLGIFWREPYKYILNANILLEGITKPNQLTPGVIKQIKGEAKFIRAFCHFYLVTLFGPVPYLTTSDYQVNSIASRMPVSEVLDKIEIDLLDAYDLLLNDYSLSNGERIQPNKSAAAALLARIYLYKGSWDKAEQFSSVVIGNSANYSLLIELNNVFLANSQEAIWQLKPVAPGVNTPQGQLFILTGPPNSASRRVSLTQGLVNSFESSDQRKLKWVGTFSNSSGTWYYAKKYKVALSSNLTEYSMILRLAEQYLIRAEARANLNKLNEAQSDLNAIRSRAGLSNHTSNDKSLILLAIEQERKVELFAEWGHRWLDLKRTGRANDILGPLKSNWNPTDVLFPIPESERLLNTNLTQNEGY